MNLYRSISLKFFLLLSCMIYSCQSVVKQLYDDSTARFNSYFIANENIKKAQEIIHNSYKWNYDEIIPIISPLDTNNIQQYYDLTNNAIEKASLLIQRHPESSLVFESYIIIGLARLYNFELKNAETTFKYVNTKSQDVKIQNLALIYLMRSYFENKKIKEAIEVYKYLEKSIINKKNKILFHLNSAYIFQLLENYDETLKNLNFIENLVSNRNQQNKILFLIGQIYQKSNFNNEAYEYYKKCLKNNPSFELSFYTKINLAKVTELTNSSDIKKVYKYFNRLLKDKKNEDYLDKIFYEIGEFEYNQQKINLAINNYNKSLSFLQSTAVQKFLNYKKLAEIYYNDFREYELSKLYYDSTLNNTNRENKEFNKLYERREILEELVNNLKKIAKNDSLIKLSTLDQNEINKIVENYINELEKKKKKVKKIVNTSFNFNDDQQEIINDNSQSNNWYFYNEIIVSRGREQFKRVWGNRKLTDNWRISRKIKLVDLEDSNIQEKENTKLAENQNSSENKIDKKKILSSIPFKKEKKLILLTETESAYYKVGNIYIQKLNEIKLGINYFTKLLNNYKESKYIPEILYQLYLVLKEKKPKEAQEYKEKLLKNYPNNLLSKLIINPNYEQDQFAENNFLINEYNKLYKKYEKKEYKIVIKQSDSIITTYSKNPYHQKFMLLQALAKGELEGNFIFQLSLKKILQKAKDNNIIEFTKELLKSSEEVNRNYYYSGVPIFLDDQNKNKYYSVFIVANDNQMPNKIIQILEKIIKDKKYKNYFIDKYNFTNEESLIAISELNQKENRNLIKEFETRYKEKIPILSKFVITEDNIKIVFETKKHTEYVEYINKKTSNE